MSRSVYPLLRNRILCVLAFLILLLSAPSFAGIDHRVNEDTGGIWRYQNTPPAALLLISVGGALFLGTEDRLGRTFWQSSESFLVTGGATEILKRTTGRLRPAQTDDPNQWRKGGHSFPSGHVSATTALVTPLILEYKDERPAVWLLAALPAYEMTARVKARAHWQTDVLAGAVLGGAIGYYEHKGGPLVVRLMPGGVFVGFQKSLK
jgi:membrane-associated phospholipid phosphatase